MALFYAAHFDTTTPLNVVVGSDAHFSKLACAASALSSASTTAEPALAPAVAVSSCRLRRPLRSRRQWHCCPPSFERAPHAFAHSRACEAYTGRT
eukprot:6174855-Pleurochrysis_carterae.AAC.1